jgi:hypothetical protein
MNLELERTLRSDSRGTLFRRVTAVAFGDAGRAIRDGAIARAVGQLRWLADAGVGLRAQHRIGDTPVTTQVLFPVWVNRPELAQDTHPSHHVGFRWLVAVGAAS